MHAASCDFVGLFFLMLRRPPRSTLTAHSFPTRRSSDFDRDSVQSTADGGVSMIIHDKKNFVAGALYVSFGARSEEHTSELQSLMRISYAVFCLKKKKPSLHYQTRKQKLEM